MWDLCTKAVKTKWILSWDLIRPYIYCLYIYSFWSLQGVALCFAVVYGYDMWNKGLIPKNNRSDSWLGIWDSNSMPHGHWNHQSDLLVGGFKTCLIFQNIWDNPSYWLFFFRGVETTKHIRSTMISSWFPPITSDYIPIVAPLKLVPNTGLSVHQIPVGYDMFPC